MNDIHGSLFLDDGFQIYDIYKTNVESDVIVKEFGNWDPQHSLKVVNPSIWERRSSLEGYHLRYWVFYNFFELRIGTIFCLRQLKEKVIISYSIGQQWH